MELNNFTKKYWTAEDIELLGKVKTVKEMFDIALRVLSRMARPVVQVCGPITSGGKGNVDLNIKYLNDKISELQEKGINVFDQMVFEDATMRLKDELSKDKYFMDLFTYFYLPVFESGFIDGLCFLPGWESSRGANWEHEQAKRLGLRITYY